jgi:diadenosine tetraphosphate (Ap4A) HIT family hydrolase
MKDYSKFLIKQYKHWGVYINENQSYLGRCVVWCDRQDAQHLTDATKEEREELFLILNDLKSAIKKAFDNNWLNFAFLGNEARHLHGHFLPRYSSVRVFEGREFDDKQWGDNWIVDNSFNISEELLMKIKNKIEDLL